jgi:hypothetical protein
MGGRRACVLTERSQRYRNARSKVRGTERARGLGNYSTVPVSAPGLRLLSRPRLRSFGRRVVVALTSYVRVVCWWVWMDGCEVRLCDPCVRVPLCARVSRGVNVNTTDATTGARTALLLPAQNTHTLHDPIRDTEHARAKDLCVPSVPRLPPVSFYWVWMVVRFVCVVCVPLCVRVSRVSRVNVNTTDATAGATCVSRLPPVSFYRSRECPGSPRCLFTGIKYIEI